MHDLCREVTYERDEKVKGPKRQVFRYRRFLRLARLALEQEKSASNATQANPLLRLARLALERHPHDSKATHANPRNALRWNDFRF